jgi:hypothetical protein
MTIKTVRNEDGLKIATLLIEGKNAIELTAYQLKSIRAAKGNQNKLNSIFSEIISENDFLTNR